LSAVGPAAQTASDIIEASRYLVLATADAAGRPWSSPVYFAHIGFAEFFWVSARSNQPPGQSTPPGTSPCVRDN
jgi:general stress protein 26